MPTCLVTGAAGFIGSTIVRALLKRGYDVRGIDNFITGKRENIQNLDFDFVEGDIRDAALMARVCRNVDYVFHEAALASVPRSVKDPATSNDINVNGTLQVLLAARNAGVRRVLYAGSSSAYGISAHLPSKETDTPAPISPYAVSKLAGEHYLQAFYSVYGLETVTIRYFNVFGPRQDPDSPYSGVLARFSMMMLDGRQPTIFGDGEQSRDFTFVENVVNANLLAALAPKEKVAGRVFNVATGSSVSLNHAFRVLQEEIGYHGLPAYSEPRAGDIRDSWADISAAREAFGYQPTVDFREGIRRTVAWYRETRDVSPELAATAD